MNLIDKIIICYSVFFVIHFGVFLLYQFEVIRIREDSMIRWIRLVSVLETVFLAIIHIFAFSKYGRYSLAVFYILSILLLLLQFIFADWGFGQKVLDVFWVLFYVALFTHDVCGVSLAEMIAFFTESENFELINNFLKNTFVGDVLLGVLIPVLRTVILQAIHRKE